jgi:hypothetical protein
LLGARSDGGVLIRPSNYAPFSRTQRVTLPATDEQTDAFHAFLQAQVGKKYDMTAIVAFAFDRDWREDDSWFCSELQAAALEAAKIVHPLSTPANKIYPAALLFMSSALAI